MVFHGLQKLTLLDYPGKVACTVFTGGCDFRCPFCHNAVLVTDIEDTEVYTEDDILSFLRKREGILDGICITGGEPLMNADIIPFLEKVRKLDYSIKIDTNGSYYDRLEEIIKNGLADYVAMDVKNSPEKYALTAGLPSIDVKKLSRSRDLIMSSGIDYEFRTTVVSEFHEVEDIREAARWISGAKRYFLQNFVDSGDLICPGLSACPREKLEKMKLAAMEFIPATELRGI